MLQGSWRCLSPLCAVSLQGLSAVRGDRSVHDGAAFLQRRAALDEDAGVKIFVAGVSQPGKTVRRRVGRLAQKWYVGAGVSACLQAAATLQVCVEWQGIRNCCPGLRPDCRWHPQAVAGLCGRPAVSLLAPAFCLRRFTCCVLACRDVREASLQQSSDAALHGALVQKSSPAASFMLSSSSAGGNVLRSAFRGASVLLLVLPRRLT